MRHAYVWIVVVLGSGCGSSSPDASAAPHPAPVAEAPRPAAPRDAGVATPGDAGAAVVASAVPCETAPEEQPAGPAHDALKLTRTKFVDVPGWVDDKLAEAVPSFLRSCAVLAKLRDDQPVGANGHGGTARQWRKACAAAAKVPAGDDAAARRMFEAEFVPWIAAGRAGVEGKMTGYFVQEMRASRKRGGKYQTPVYGRPKDLVEIELGKFIRDGHARRIWGRFDAGGKLEPYFTRAEIRKGALAGRGLELLYIDEPIDLLFAHIEGSAKAKLDDGSVVWLEFAGKNGRAYKGVGGILKEIGAFPTPGSGTMQGIRAWFENNRSRWNEIVDQVHSFVFFAESKAPGSVGTQTILTAQRSLAVDRAFIALSTPVWVETRAPIPGTPNYGPWRKLLIAQDTGGGIQGAVRGDIYWGDDATAADIGGRMGGKGRFWLLLPKGVTK
jgi:membrane-bound lytic murein transglycosylase A